MSRPDDSLLAPEQLVAVRRHANHLLDKASAFGRFPTPIDDLMAAAKLTIIPDEELNEHFLLQFIKKAKEGVKSSIKTALSKVLGFFDPEGRLIFIDKDTPSPKVPFIKLHEAGHGEILHQNKMYRFMQDCEKTLDADTTDLFEREANVFASEVLFQGILFGQEAHDQDFGIMVPIGLAQKYGASNYSAIRRYTTTNPRACCVVVLDPTVTDENGDFTAMVRRVVVSESFSKFFNTSQLGANVTKSHVFAKLVPRFGKQKTVKPTEIVLTGRNGEERVCVAESFKTSHNTFILVRDGGKQPKKSVVISSTSGEKFNSSSRDQQTEGS